MHEYLNTNLVICKGNNIPTLDPCMYECKINTPLMRLKFVCILQYLSKMLIEICFNKKIKLISTTVGSTQPLIQYVQRAPSLG